VLTNCARANFLSHRLAEDPRALAGSLNYRTLANKTFSFSPEQRQYVLGLRALNREDGNDYAIANYRLGEWMADNALSLLAEAGIDKDTISLSTYTAAFPLLCASRVFMMSSQR
jgi:hypothetical protein